MIFKPIYKKPVLLAGNGVRTSGAVEMVQEFAMKTKIPLLTTMNGVDIAQDDLHIGFIGTHGNRIANMILHECDLIVSVGARLSLRQVGRYTANFAPQAHLVRADIDESELSRNVKVNEDKFHTDARDFMRKIQDESVGNFSAWRKQCLEAKAILDDFDKQPGNYAVEAIGELLPENANVSVDVGMNQCWCAQSLVLKGYKGRIHISGGYGTMGCGLPFAIGSAIAEKGKTVFCITGDGGFQMNIQELETVKRENLPIKIIVLNNHVLGKISETQHFNHDNRFACTAMSGGYSVPDFVKIANAYGIKAKKLASYGELSRFKEWIDDKDPCLFDVSLPENSFLTPKIKWETSKISPDLPEEIVTKVKQILGR
jgi:acetolactate synthase-1/2/3 large subunit